MQIQGYSKTIAATATPVNVQNVGGTVFKFAKELIIQCPAGNTSDIKIGNREGQAFTVAKGTRVELSTISNRMSQSDKYDLTETFILAGTNGDKVEIIAIDPTN